MDATKVLTSLDIMRDGGSICVSFASGHATYKLIFNISDDSCQEEVSSEEPGRTLFCDAGLEEYQLIKWTSPTTGITYDETKDSYHQISWEDSMAILRELEPQLKGFESDYHWVFDEMLHVAANNGTGLLRDARGRVIL